MLSELVEGRLGHQYAMWAAEVEFDKGTDRGIRIDYMGFSPRCVRNVTAPSSVELGKFDCYEVKSCMADFNSGHGLNFIGDRNFLVTTREVAEALCGKVYIYYDVLVPDGPRGRLVPYMKGNDPYVGRTRPASEMLWQMCRARNNRVVSVDA